MRVALVSDIHSNLPALKAVLAAIDAEPRGVDHLVSLGDVVDMGPEPSACLSLLRERGAIFVGGNHDPLDESPRHPLLLAIERWTQAQLSSTQRRFIAGWPLTHTIASDGFKLLCVHGSPRANTDNILVDLPHESLIEMVGAADFDVLACGHTHVQLLRRLGRRTVVNVGSVGMPFEKPYMGGAAPKVYPWAEFAIVELSEHGHRIELRQCPYRFDDYIAACHASGMPKPGPWVDSWDY